MGKVNAKNKKASVTMLMPDKIDFGKKKKKIDFETRSLANGMQGNVMMMRESFHQNIKSTHVYASVTAFQSVWGKNGQNYKENRDQATKFWDLMLSETDEARWKKNW